MQRSENQAGGQRNDARAVRVKGAEWLDGAPQYNAEMGAQFRAARRA